MAVENPLRATLRGEALVAASNMSNPNVGWSPQDSYASLVLSVNRTEAGSDDGENVALT